MRSWWLGIQLDMQKININFYKPKRIFAWQQVGLVLLLLSIIVNVTLVIKKRNNTEFINEISSEIDRIKHPPKVILTTKNNTEDPVIKRQLNESHEIVRQLNREWALLLKTLEDTRGSDVDLLAITPNTQTGEVLIIGQAESLKLTFEYIERLKKCGIFSKAELNDHQKIMLNGSAVLRFTIVADWIAAHE